MQKARELSAEKQNEENLEVLSPSWENVPKGYITPSFRKHQNFGNEIRNFGKRTGRIVSTTKDKILWVREGDLTRVEEGNFKERKQMILYGQHRRINDTRVFFELGQKTFFISIGEMLSELKLDSRIVVIIKVGNIQGNEGR
jgi:hypothetical protein